MSWKCVCNETENSDESTLCKNCGRNRPKYLGLKIELGHKGKMSPEQKSIWALIIANSYLSQAKERLKDYKGSHLVAPDKARSYLQNAESCCQLCRKFLERSSTLSPDAQFEDEQGYVYSSASIKSEYHFQMGMIKVHMENLGQAIEHFQNSFEADPNQVSIFNIFVATTSLPVEGGGFFGGKKKEAALATKREQETDLLLKVVRFAPFSNLGIQCAKMLFEDYKVTDIDI